MATTGFRSRARRISINECVKVRQMGVQAKAPAHGPEAVVRDYLSTRMSQ